MYILPGLQVPSGEGVLGIYRLSPGVGVDEVRRQQRQNGHEKGGKARAQGANHCVGQYYSLSSYCWPRSGGRS